MQENSDLESLYEVESIIGKKKIRGKVFYQVKWKGYSEQQCTWEVPSHLRYVKQLIEAYQQKHTQNLTSNQSQDQDKRKKIDDDTNEPQIDPHVREPFGQKGLIANDHMDKDEDKNDTFELHKTIKMITQVQKGTTSQLRDSLTQEKNNSSKKSKKDKEKYIQKKKKFEPKKIIDSIRQQNRESKKSVKQNKKLVKNINEESTKSKIIPITKSPKQEDSEQQHKNGRSHLLLSYKPKISNSSNFKNKISNLPQTNETLQIFKIRSLDDDTTFPNNQNREYLVQYPNQALRIFSTVQLMMTHPIQFISYLQRKAHKK